MVISIIGMARPGLGFVWSARIERGAAVSGFSDIPDEAAGSGNIAMLRVIGNIAFMGRRRRPGRGAPHKPALVFARRQPRSCA